MSNFINVEIDGLTSQPEVISLSGSEQISNDYSFFLVVKTPIDNPIDAISCLNHTLKVVYEGVNDIHAHVGTITSVQHDFSSNPHHLQFTLECHSPLYSLKSVVRSNVFLDYSLLDVITEILNGYIEIDFSIHCINSLPNKEFIHQYKETDYDFINRLCEHWGVYYYFDPEQSNKLIFADDEDYPKLNNILQLLENPNPKQRQNSITSLKMQENSVINHVVIEGRNPELDSQVIRAESGEPSLTIPPLILNSIGIDNEEEALLISQRRLEQQQCQRQIYTGSATAQNIKPGFIITVQLPGHQSTIQLLVLTLDYQANNLNSGDANELDRFTVNFSAIPAEIIFRPQISTPMPTAISSTARVYSRYDDVSFADRDELGRYRVVFDYMQSNMMSHWIRKNQAAAKNNHLDAPLLPGTEVQIAYLGGNPDLPYISCALENSQSIQTPSNNIHASATSFHADRLLKIKAKGSFSCEFTAPMDKLKKINPDSCSDEKYTLPDKATANEYLKLDNVGVTEVPDEKLSLDNEKYNISVTTGQSYKIQDTINYYLGDYPSFYFGQQYKEVHMKDPNQKSVNDDHIFSFSESHILSKDKKIYDGLKTIEDEKNTVKTEEGESEKNKLVIDRQVGMVRKLFGNRYNYHDGNIVAIRKGDDNEAHKTFNYGARYVEHIVKSEDSSINSITDGFPEHLQPEETDYITRNYHRQFKINHNDTVTIQEGNTERIHTGGSRKTTFNGLTLDKTIDISGDFNKKITAANINSVIDVDTLDQTLTGNKRSITLKSDSSIVAGAKSSIVAGPNTSLVVGANTSVKCIADISTVLGISGTLIAGQKSEVIFGNKLESIHGLVTKIATQPEIKKGAGNIKKEEYSIQDAKMEINSLKVSVTNALLTMIG
ncbi:MAG: Rhs element Vgr protein [Psychrobacter glaciei]|jgi:Rhs element Vgr protein